MNRILLTQTACAAVVIATTLSPASAIAEDGKPPEPEYGMPFLWFLEMATRIPAAETAEAADADEPAPKTTAMEVRMGLPAGTLSTLEEAHGLPEGVLSHIARVESAGNPNAKAKTSSAAGAYQWLNGSWRDATRRIYGRTLPLSDRYDAGIAAEVTAAWLGQEWGRVRAESQRAGIDDTLGVYLVHFLGSRGAERFMHAYADDPQAAASSLMTKRQMRANASIFYDNRGNVRTLASVAKVLSGRLEGSATVVSSGGAHQAEAVIEVPPAADIALSAGKWTHAMLGRRFR